MKSSSSKLFWQDKDIEQVIGNILRIGVFVAAIVCIIGGVIYLFGHGYEQQPAYTVFKGEPSELTSMLGVVRNAFLLHSTSIMQLGVLLLMATPVIRVLFSFFAFLAEKDYMYVVITFIVLIIIAVSMFGFIKG